MHVELNEVELQRNVKLAGGKWIPQHKVWHLRYDQAVAIGLEARIELRKVPNTRSPGNRKVCGNGSMGRGGGAVRGASGDLPVPQLASGEAATRPRLPVPSPPLEPLPRL